MSGSVKGILMAPAVDALRRLLDEGRVGPEDLENELLAQDLEYLKSTIVPSLWYPVAACGRYVDCLWNATGRDAEFFARSGAFAARKVLAGPAYADQIETAKRWGSHQVARAVIHFAARLYDFMDWRLVGDFEAASYAIEVEGAEAWPDVLRRTSEGFIRELHSDAQGRALSVRSRRSDPGRVVFEIDAA